MNNEKTQTEQDLSEGELVDQEPLETVEDPASRLSGSNQIPDFGDDTDRTLRGIDKESAD